MPIHPITPQPANPIHVLLAHHECQTFSEHRPSRPRWQASGGRVFGWSHFVRPFFGCFFLSFIDGFAILRFVGAVNAANSDV